MLRLSDRPIPALGTYTLAALLAFLELAVLWQALHPDVSPEYRAYYIDRTNTCLPQPVTGAYTLGLEIDFRSENTRELRPCGWEGPAGDGVHAIGRQSRLRLATGPAQPLVLMLEMTGVSLAGPPAQRVVVSVNGAQVGEARVLPGQTTRFTFDVPESAIGDTGFAEIALDYPDAIRPPGVVSDTHFRSIKLVAGSLSPA
jgi:hypothetical protein